MYLFPNLNSSLSDNCNSLIIKKYINIGIAVNTTRGLFVPVIKNVDKKGIMNISHDLNDLSIKTRNGTIKSDDLQGGSFTISNLGNIGTIGFSPIINAPEVGILGISKAQIKPKYNEQKETFIPRIMLPVSLSVDHRAINGAEAAYFLKTFCKFLEDIRELLL